MKSIFLSQLSYILYDFLDSNNIYSNLCAVILHSSASRWTYILGWNIPKNARPGRPSTHSRAGPGSGERGVGRTQALLNRGQTSQNIHTELRLHLFVLHRTSLLQAKALASSGTTSTNRYLRGSPNNSWCSLRWSLSKTKLFSLNVTVLTWK